MTPGAVMQFLKDREARLGAAILNADEQNGVRSEQSLPPLPAFVLPQAPVNVPAIAVGAVTSTAVDERSVLPSAMVQPSPSCPALVP